MALDHSWNERQWSANYKDSFHDLLTEFVGKMTILGTTPNGHSQQALYKHLRPSIEFTVFRAGVCWLSFSYSCNDSIIVVYIAFLLLW